MLITDIYRHYQILPNLQTHMLSVAAVGEWLIDHWLKPSFIDPLTIRHTLLLHDMGNILKFDLNKGKHFLGDEQNNLTHWLQVQTDFKTKFGSNEHHATYTIAQEIGVSPEVLETLANMGSNQTEQNVAQNNFNHKICTYSDMRVAPHGLVTVDQRFDDGINRYQKRPGFSFDQAEKNRNLCLVLEHQLQQHLSKPLTQLTSTDLEPYIPKLKLTQL